MPDNENASKITIKDADRSEAEQLRIDIENLEKRISNYQVGVAGVGVDLGISATHAGKVDGWKVQLKEKQQKLNDLQQKNVSSASVGGGANEKPLDEDYLEQLKKVMPDLDWTGINEWRQKRLRLDEVLKESAQQPNEVQQKEIDSLNADIKAFGEGANNDVIKITQRYEAVRKELSSLYDIEKNISSTYDQYKTEYLNANPNDSDYMTREQYHRKLFEEKINPLEKQSNLLIKLKKELLTGDSQELPLQSGTPQQPAQTQQQAATPVTPQSTGNAGAQVSNPPPLEEFYRGSSDLKGEGSLGRLIYALLTGKFGIIIAAVLVALNVVMRPFLALGKFAVAIPVTVVGWLLSPVADRPFKAGLSILDSSYKDLQAFAGFFISFVPPIILESGYFVLNKLANFAYKAVVNPLKIAVGLVAGFFGLFLSKTLRDFAMKQLREVWVDVKTLGDQTLLATKMITPPILNPFSIINGLAGLKSITLKQVGLWVITLGPIRSLMAAILPPGTPALIGAIQNVLNPYSWIPPLFQPLEKSSRGINYVPQAFWDRIYLPMLRAAIPQGMAPDAQLLLVQNTVDALAAAKQRRNVSNAGPNTQPSATAPKNAAQGAKQTTTAPAAPIANFQPTVTPPAPNAAANQGAPTTNPSGAFQQQIMQRQVPGRSSTSPTGQGMQYAYDRITNSRGQGDLQKQAQQQSQHQQPQQPTSNNQIQMSARPPGGP